MLQHFPWNECGYLTERIRLPVVAAGVFAGVNVIPRCERQHCVMHCLDKSSRRRIGLVKDFSLVNMRQHTKMPSLLMPQGLSGSRRGHIWKLRGQITGKSHFLVFPGFSDIDLYFSARLTTFAIRSARVT